MSGLSCEIPVMIKVPEQLQKERYGTQKPFCHVCQIQTRGLASIPNISDKWLAQKNTTLVLAAVSLKPEMQIPSSYQLSSKLCEPLTFWSVKQILKWIPNSPHTAISRNPIKPPWFQAVSLPSCQVPSAAVKSQGWVGASSAVPGQQLPHALHIVPTVSTAHIHILQQVQIKLILITTSFKKRFNMRLHFSCSYSAGSWDHTSEWEQWKSLGAFPHPWGLKPQDRNS